MIGILPPRIGSYVYIESFYGIVGGRTTVIHVSRSTVRGRKDWLVRVIDNPDTQYSWSILSAKQRNLAEKFGNQFAYKDSNPMPERLIIGDWGRWKKKKEKKSEM